MTGTSSRRLALAGVAVLALALRVFPFFGPDGAWSARVDYDEGVYFSAASYLLRGVLPWRDFVFAHPPGLLLFLAGTSAWTGAFIGVAHAFTLARWVAALLGVINTLLVAKALERWNGAAALLGAAIYATYPELVQVERGPFLEPLLNCVCLLLVLTLAQADGRRRWLLGAGALAGVAVSIKLWAVVWVLGAAWAAFAQRGLRPFIVGAVLAGVVLVGPFFLLAPGAFFEQVVMFHAWRPPDGLTERLPRVEQLVSVRHLASPLLALAAVAVLTWKRGWTAVSRVSVTAWVLTLVGFFASPAYWNQYNAHLVASEALVAAGAFSLLPVRFFRLAVVATLVSLGVSVSHAVRRSLPLATEHLVLAQSPLATTPDCVFTFEPGWSLAADRLPAHETGPLVDSYAAQLLDAVRGGKKFASSTEAFSSRPTPSPGLSACRFVVAGARGARQLSLDELAKTHHLVKVGALEVWERD